MSYADNGSRFSRSVLDSWSGLFLVSHFSVIASVLRGCINCNAIINAAAGSQEEGRI